MKSSGTNDAAALLHADIMQAAGRTCTVPANFCSCGEQLPPVPVRDQKQTGRCWLEAGLGDLEWRVFRATGRWLPALSSEYLAYYDLRWKIHLFLRQMENTKQLPVDHALCAHFLKKPVQDAGQWAPFMTLLKRVGVMPAQCLPHSVHHENTHTLLAGLCQKLRYCACQLRAGRASVQTLENEAVSILDRCLGTPPERFLYEGNEYTPLQFYQTFIGSYIPEDDLSLVSVPSTERPYFTAYQVKWLYSPTEQGSPVVHYNIPPALFKQMAREQLREGMPVWIGADAAHFSDRDKGVFDTRLYALEELFDTTLQLPKGEAMLYQDSAMSHAMLLWGSADEGWCVRNSFGSKIGQNGYAWMSDAWFDRYVYQAIIRRDIASRFMDCSALDRAPVRLLEPWDALGCLAGKGCTF